jgi:hypothetical protein
MCVLLAAGAPSRRRSRPAGADAATLPPCRRAGSPRRLGPARPDWLPAPAADQLLAWRAAAGLQRAAAGGGGAYMMVPELPERLLAQVAALRGAGKDKKRRSKRSGEDKKRGKQKERKDKRDKKSRKHKSKSKKSKKGRRSSGSGSDSGSE